MILYHGSNVTVRKPRLFASARALDFGAGFYLTTSIEQAEQWAKIVQKRQMSGVATISEFAVDDIKFDTLRIRRFTVPDTEWLLYISTNRKAKGLPFDYDVVTGPVANDNTMSVINMYLKGAYDEEETLKRLLPQKLKDQYAFKTEKALELLVFTKDVVL